MQLRLPVILAVIATLGACASHTREPVPRWTAPAPAPAAPAYTAAAPDYTAPSVPVAMEAPAPVATPRTWTAGCTGSFTLTDTRTGRMIDQGRATNTGNGFTRLDARGRVSGALASATASQTLLFLPDCGCNPRQTSGLSSGTQVAQATPASQVCSAG